MRKPKLIISKCLNSEKCRYDGQGFDDKVISTLKKHIDVETICPEVEIGLSIPRDPIRIERHGEVHKLIQRNSNYDYTNNMNEFAQEFISTIKDVDGFILKSKSPSCGIKDVKVYPKGNKCSISKNETGFFSKKLIDKYKNIPIENEGRLKNYIIRDEFLTKIFTINNLKTSDIKLFHKFNKLLLNSYDKEITSELENIVNKENIKAYDIEKYNEGIYNVLNQKRSKSNKLNTIEKIFKKYECNLNEEESKYNKELLDKYYNQKTPYTSLIVASKMYAKRFNDRELLNQTFFNPYPEELVEVYDSGKGRNL